MSNEVHESVELSRYLLLKLISCCFKLSRISGYHSLAACSMCRRCRKTDSCSMYKGSKDSIHSNSATNFCLAFSACKVFSLLALLLLLLAAFEVVSLCKCP